MKQFIKDSPGFTVVYLLFTAASVGLMTVFRLFPFVDLPNHLAAATICKYIGHADNLFANYFDTSLWLNSNVFHVLFCMSDIFPSIEFANHVYFALYALLLPLSLFVVIRQLGGNVWFSLFGLLMLNNFNVMWGFAGYALALPLLIFAFSLMIAILTSQSWTPRVGLALLLVGLFFVHAQVTLFGMLLFVVCCVYHHRKRLSAMFVDLTALLPVVVLFMVWWQTQEGQPDTLAYLANYYSGDYWSWFNTRWKLVVLDNFFIYEGAAGYWIAGLFSAAIIIPVLIGLFFIRKESTELRKRPEARLTVIFVLLSLALFIVLPHQIPGQPIVYERLTVLFMLSLIIFGSLFYRHRLATLAKTGLAVLLVLYFALWFDYYHEFNEAHASLRPETFPENSYNSTVAGLVYDFEFRGQAINIHMPYYYIIWRRGIMPASFIDYRFGVVRRKVGFDVLPRYRAWEGLAWKYNGYYAGMDYIVVYGAVPQHIVPRLQQFAFAKRTGPWVLYENQLKK